MEETIEEKLIKGRSEMVDFLPSIIEVEEAAKILISFANNRGGSLLIGVNLKGKVVGVFPEPEITYLKKVEDFIDGKITFNYHVHKVKHHFIIEILISESTLPLKFKSDFQNSYYYRINSTSVEANKILNIYLNLRKFSQLISISEKHSNLLTALNTETTLSMLYKSVDLKPKEIDQLLSELLYLDKVTISIVEKTFYYSKK